MTDSARQALLLLRDPGHFQWYVIPLLALVGYVYAVEIERRRWSLVFAGLAFWGMDTFNELANAVYFHLDGSAPIWGAPGGSSYLILIGLNIEICLFFAVSGVVFAKTLPKDPALRIVGLPNRLFFALLGSLLCLLVELVLNAMGVLTWEQAWWSARIPLLILIFGYLPFFVVAFWVHDLPSARAQARVVGLIWGVDALGVAVFGLGLGWL